MFVIAFLPRSKCLLILWLQSASTVILEPKKIKWIFLIPSHQAFISAAPSVCHILLFWKHLLNSPSLIRVKVGPSATFTKSFLIFCHLECTSPGNCFLPILSTVYVVQNCYLWKHLEAPHQTGATKADTVLDSPWASGSRHTAGAVRIAMLGYKPRKYTNAGSTQLGALWSWPIHARDWLATLSASSVLSRKGFVSELPSSLFPYNYLF